MQKFICSFVSLSVVIAYDDKENSKQSVQCLSILNSQETVDDPRHHSSSTFESAEHAEYVVEHSSNLHPTEQPELCPHCRDAYVGYSSDEDSDAWYSDRERCASPSDCARIARFPSPPTHPFDPFYETKIQAIECMLNSPSQYESTDYSSAEDIPCRHCERNSTGPSIPHAHARHMWPSPPNERNSKGKERMQSSASRGDKGISRNACTINDSTEFGRQGESSTSSQRDHGATHADSISYPGVGYFQLPESFLREFAL